MERDLVLEQAREGRPLAHADEGRRGALVHGGAHAGPPGSRQGRLEPEELT